MWNPLHNSIEKRQLWLWVHPAAFEDVLKTLEESSNKVVVESRQNDFSRFRLVGPRSHAILNAVCNLVKESPFGNTSPEAVKVVPRKGIVVNK